MNAKVSCLAGLIVVFLTACSRSPESQPVPIDLSVQTQAAPPAEATATGVDAAQIEATLFDLTQAVRKYGAEKQRVPKDLNELVAAGYLSAVPTAPAGKKFAIGNKMQVYLADN